jgi:ketosteroid isomerase-like protein
MNERESRNMVVVRAYFDGCNTGNLEDLIATLTPDVAHYFLPSSFPPIKGAEHLARYWRKYKLALDPLWSIDRLIASGDEVVNEWSCLWSPPGSDARRMARGTEWYVMRDNKIAEVRAYFSANPDLDTELATFPYGARGYLVQSG